ncbi:MAG: hypothetical protein EOM23_02540 [Candidatus Moranbacteria bacterium]|nr:hypothetical protein [Candidatus Moranbacteria bacterium]
MNFLKTGSEGRKFFDEEKQKQQEQLTSGNVRGYRFKLNQSATGYVVFLDDLDTFLLEHQYQSIKPDGKINYYNYETCIRDIEGECPLCENGNNPSLVSVSTIFDLTEYKKKDGTIAPPRKKIIVLKKGGTERFLRKQEKLGGLKLKKFEIFRSSDQKGEATGTDVEFEKEVDPEVLRQFCPEKEKFEDWIKPYDYNEIFQPKSAAEIRRLIGIADPVGSNEAVQEPAKGSLKDMI